MKSKGEQWIAAYQWALNGGPLPDILNQVIQKEYRKAILKAKIYKPKIKMDKKIKSIPSLKKELDKHFSIFIRMRDSCQNEIGRCVTCGTVKMWMAMDCGHFMPRQRLATRWDEKNCYLQCKRCNGFNGGEQAKMSEYIDLIHGYGEAEALVKKSKTSFKLDRVWIQGKINYYKNMNARNKAG